MPVLKKGSKQAKDYMAKIRAMKGNSNIGQKVYLKNGKPRKTLTKDMREYNKDVDAYKYFIVYNNRVDSGWEYREDAKDELNDNYEKGTAQIMSLMQIKRLGIKNPINDWKYEIGAYTKGSSRFIEYNEKPIKGKTNYRVERHDTTLLNKGGTFKKFSKIKGVSNHKDTKSHNVNIRVMSGSKKSKYVGSVYENKIPTGKKMYVLINEFAYIYANNGKLREYLKNNTNNWIEIDTNFLFDDQYNTIDGFRIYDTMISSIKNDARVGNKQFETSDECCFLKWNGIKPYPRVIPEDLPSNLAKKSTQFKNEFLIGTYTLKIINQHYCLQNSRQTIKFLFYMGDYYLTTGIGYRKRLNLTTGYPVQYKIPSDVKLKLYKIMNSI
jgi:hypothetical protein